MNQSCSDIVFIIIPWYGTISIRPCCSNRFNIVHAWPFVRQYIGHILENTRGNRIILSGRTGWYKSRRRLNARLSIESLSSSKIFCFCFFSCAYLFTNLTHSGSSSNSDGSDSIAGYNEKTLLTFVLLAYVSCKWKMMSGRMAPTIPNSLQRLTL